MAQLSDNIHKAAALIARARYVVALAGAGLSAGSGIPTYRGAGGIYTAAGTQHGAPPLLSYQEFALDPAAWWQRRLAAEIDPSHPVYQMKQAVDRAVPNAGHLALAELERRGILRCLITQNVDNLQTAAGSRAVLEIHGNRNRLRCLQCGLRFHRGDFEAQLSSRPEHTEGACLANGPPLCGECGGLLKLDTVMFGEPIPPDTLQACREAAERCDCMLLVGTSGTVNPAARLPLAARERGSILIEVNPEPTSLTPWCDVALAGPADDILPRLLNRL
jgi:NAD-dependent deacetylase